MARNTPIKRHHDLISASRRNGKRNYKASIQNGGESPRRFFVPMIGLEKGGFYSVNVTLRGAALLRRPART